MQKVYPAAIIEAVTGVGARELRLWDHRGVYTCDRVRLAASGITGPEKAEYVYPRHRRGYHEYIYADMVRIVVLRALMDAGIRSPEARQIVYAINVRAERVERLMAADEVREYLIWAQGTLPIQTQRGWADLEGVARFSGGRPAIVLNLSSIRRNILRRLAAALRAMIQTP